MKFTKIILPSIFASSLLITSVVQPVQALAATEDTIQKTTITKDVIVNKDTIETKSDLDELGVVHTLGMNSNGEIIEIQPVPTSGMSLMASGRITLGSYVLTKAQTKTLANHMKALTGAKYNTLVGLLGTLGPNGAVVAAATILAGNAQFKAVVVKAAAQGKRVRVTVTDSATLHTSYSIQVSYSMVN